MTIDKSAAPERLEGCGLPCGFDCNGACFNAPAPQPAPPTTAETLAQPVTVTYRNWRGEVSERSIIPEIVWFGSTEWHPEPQWLVKAFDTDKGAKRDFALKDFCSPQQPETPAPPTPAEPADALREAMRLIATMTANHAGQTPNEYRMQEIARAALAAAPQPAPEQETCGNCCGTGTAGHPDSGYTCHRCKGSGGVATQLPARMDRETLVELLAAELGDSYDCTRVWSAWSYGTMAEDDFEPVNDRVDQIADALLARGLRLPTDVQPETLAWGVMGQDGSLKVSLCSSIKANAEALASVDGGQKLVRVAIRVVDDAEGGNVKP